MRKSTIAFAALVVILTVTLSVRSIVSDEDAVVTVDAAKTHQTMKGWEVTARLWEQNKQEDRYDPSWQDYKEELFSRLVNELGIDRIRIEIRSGAENPVDNWTSFERQKIGYQESKRHRYEKINDNNNPNLIDSSGFQFSELNYQVEHILLPLRRLIEANGEKLFVNLTYVDFGSTKGNISHALQPEEYAELLYATFEHLKETYDITPDALEIILEPDHTDNWRGREIGASMVMAVKRLNEAGYFPEVIAPSTATALAALDYFDKMMEVPGAGEVISTFSYHRYDGVLANIALPRIWERAQRFGVATAMLEHLTGDVAELHDDLTIANVSSWQQWAIATSSAERANQGSYYYFVDFSNRDEPIVGMASRTRELAQYFRFVRAGAVRIDATSNSAGKKAVAFKNAGGTHVVIIQASRRGTISVQGLPSGSYGVRYTTDAETGRELGVIVSGSGKPLIAHIPAKGVMTFYQKMPTPTVKD